jgi:hypothetical protein
LGGVVSSDYSGDRPCFSPWLTSSFFDDIPRKMRLFQIKMNRQKLPAGFVYDQNVFHGFRLERFDLLREKDRKAVLVIISCSKLFDHAWFKTKHSAGAEMTYQIYG